MKSRPADPRRLDVEAFAQDAGELQGEWPLASLDRLAGTAHPDAKPADTDLTHWQVQGESRPVRGGVAQTWLHLRADARVSLVCQRCLGPVGADVHAERSFQFVSGEDAAAQLDADSEDDVLALTRSLDLRDLVEDELLLALPLVPRHEVCPQPLPMAHDDPEEDARTNPFAALAALKRGGPAN
ncbi:MAG TPA: YceD family protein [Albitalea sp.]|uniref:YceD family protein n=1 Tax=Piscinibacter sp. TaxID=1903157 RepID=UPI002ED240ED